MELYLDEQLLDHNLLGAGTLEEGLRSVTERLTPAHRILVGFRCDGRDIAGPRIADALQKPVESYRKLELFSAAREDLVTSTMTHASASLDDSEASVQRVADALVEGRVAEAVHELADCLKVWQQVHDAVAKSLALLEVDPAGATIGDLPVQEALARPKEVLLQVRQALVAQDYVLLADLLQFEFSDVTELWHGLIARLKRQADDLRAAARTT